MATPRKAPPRRATSPQVTYNRNDPNHVLVDPRWLGKVFGYTILTAFVCAYLLMCALFHYGSWQWVLHPTHNANSGTGLPGELVHFGPDASGQPQLTGEWIPAAANQGATAIYLRPGDGQLDFADTNAVRMLRDSGINVLAFDYRGYGRSASKPHPTEARMQEDAEAAWNYAVHTRYVQPDRVVLFGAGVGASLATTLASSHPETAALLLRNASADVVGTIRREKRARMFPVALLLRDRFDLGPLARLSTPKLLYDVGAQPADPEDAARQRAYHGAADPKMLVTLPQTNPAEESASLRRFLDEHPALQSTDAREPQSTDASSVTQK